MRGNYYKIWAVLLFALNIQFVSAVILEKPKVITCKYRECVTCKKGLENYLMQFSKEYGGLQSVYSDLMEIENGNKEDHFSDDFYKTYGPFLIHWFSASSKDSDFLYEILLKKGTNIYASIDGDYTVAEQVIDLIDNPVTLSIFVSLGDLNRCPNILNNMIYAARVHKKKHKYELLKSILN